MTKQLCWSLMRAGLATVILGCPLAVLAEPVTRADIAGKTICQDNGVKVTYHANGSAVSNRFGRGTWDLNGSRLSLNAETAFITNTIEKEGNQFHIYRKLQVGNNFDTYGHYCE